jgi:hypothetical protein
MSGSPLPSKKLLPMSIKLLPVSIFASLCWKSGCVASYSNVRYRP